MSQISYMYCCHIQFSSTTLLCQNILPNHTISEKIPKNRLEYMELTTDRSYSVWNSLSKLEKEWNLQVWSTKTLHNLGVFYFDLRVFKGWNTLLWKLTCYDLWVFRISKTNLTSVEYSKRHFLDHPSCFYWSRPLIGR